MNRILPAILVVFVTLSASVVWAGGNTETTTETEISTGSATAYPIEGNPKLSYYAPENAHVLAVSKSWDETPFIKAWAEQTGVNLEAGYYSDFSLLVASGDYPDIICGNWKSYSGGIGSAINDGIIIPVEGYLEKYAPDYLRVLRSNEEWEKGSKTPDGHVAGFFNLRAEPALNSFGIIMRQDWLEAVGMKTPTTIDEFYNALIAFRDQMGATAPFSLTPGNLKALGGYGLVTSPFGLVTTGYYQEDGLVHFGAREDSHRDVLVWLNRLYEEGLLDKNVLTIDSTTEASNIMNGISGATVGFASGRMGVWLTTMKDVDPRFKLTGVGSLVAEAGDRAMFGQRQDSVSSLAAITTDCDDVETAVRLLNYGYSEAGNLLMYYGVEGISFELMEGYPYFTDFVKNNPDGLSFARALSQYDYSPANGPYISNGDYSMQTYNDAQLNALAVWRENAVNEHYIPSLDIAPEDVDEYSAIMSEVSTFVDEQFALFVTGGRPIKEFNEYLETLDSMKIGRMVQIYQNALDEYNAR